MTLPSRLPILKGRHSHHHGNHCERAAIRTSSFLVPLFGFEIKMSGTIGLAGTEIRQMVRGALTQIGGSTSDASTARVISARFTSLRQQSRPPTSVSTNQPNSPNNMRPISPTIDHNRQRLITNPLTNGTRQIVPGECGTDGLSEAPLPSWRHC